MKKGRTGTTPCDKCKTATLRHRIRLWGQKWLCRLCVIDVRRTEK